MPDWCRSTILTIGLALIGWLLLQELDTGKRLAILETNVTYMQQSIDTMRNVILPLLKQGAEGP